MASLGGCMKHHTYTASCPDCRSVRGMASGENTSVPNQGRSAERSSSSFLSGVHVRNGSGGESKSKSESMLQKFQVYVVGYCRDQGQIQVLVAKKNTQSKWWGQNKRGSEVKNNPGQPVFPGGSENATNAKEAGCLEFEQETGMSFQTTDSGGNIIVDLHCGDVANHVVCKYKSIRIKEFRSNGSCYHGMFVEIENTTALDNIINSFKWMSGLDSERHENGRHPEKFRKDDELESLHVVTLDQALCDFRDANNKDTKGKPMGGSKHSTDWFVTLLSDLEKELVAEERLEKKRQGGDGSGMSSGSNKDIKKP